jgi:hypothetical protein
VDKYFHQLLLGPTLPAAGQNTESLSRPPTRTTFLQAGALLEPFVAKLRRLGAFILVRPELPLLLLFSVVCLLFIILFIVICNCGGCEKLLLQSVID